MPETVGVDRLPVAKGPAIVSASAWALHLDCSRAYIGKLEAEGVLQRQRNGFELDAAWVAYLRFLRRERQRSLRHEADADHVKASRSLSVVRITGMTLGWIGSTTAFGEVVRKHPAGPLNDVGFNEAWDG